MVSNLCTYISFERSLNDDKKFSFKTKLIFMSILRVFKTYNLLLNITYTEKLFISIFTIVFFNLGKNVLF